VHETRSKTLSVTINAPFERAWDFIADAGNLHLWTVDFALVPPQRKGGVWVVDTPRGRLDLFVESDRRSGAIVFHFGRDGRFRTSPSRLRRRGLGVVYSFTVHEPDDAEPVGFERLVANVSAELARLREVLEDGCGPTEDGCGPTEDGCGPTP
jgi:hypothetical protein